MKILNGERKDRINKSEPQSPPGLGDPPDWFDDHARSAWARLKERLGPMGVTTRADEEAAMVYCQCYSTWRQAIDVVELEGMSITSTTETKTKSGSTIREVMKANPLLPTVRESQRQMMQCLAQFGMTPSSRAGLHIQEKPADDPLLAFLAGKKTGTSDGKTARRK